MAEQVALRVLRPRAAEIRADTPVDGRAFLDRAVFHGHTAQQHEAPSIEHVTPQAVEDGAQGGEGKVVAADGGEVTAANHPGGSLNLRGVRWAEPEAPLRLPRRHIRTGPGGGAFDRRPTRGGGQCGFSRGHQMYLAVWDGILPGEHTPGCRVVQRGAGGQFD